MSPRRFVALRGFLPHVAIAVSCLALGAAMPSLASEARERLGELGIFRPAATGGAASGSDRDHRKSSSNRQISKTRTIPRELPSLRRALDAEPPPVVAAELVERIGILGNGDDVDRLLPLLDSPNPRLSQAAAMALGRLRAAGAADELLDLAHGADPQRGALAVQALGLSEDPRVVDALVKLSRDSDAWRRVVALESLAQRGGAKARAAVHRAFIKGPATEAWQVASAVATLGEKPDIELLVRVATNIGDPRGDAAMQALGGIAGPDVDRALIQVARESRWPRKASALAALANVRDPEAVDVLVAAARENRMNRYSVLSTLGSSRAPGALEALLDLAADARPDEVPSLASALAFRPEPEAREAMYELARQGGSAGQAALSALAMMEDKGAVALMAEAFDLDGQLPPQEALVFLARGGGEEGWSLLEEVLAEGNSGDRSSVIWALQARGDEDATSRLLDIARSDDQWVSGAAMGALESMGEDARGGLVALLTEKMEDPDAPDFDQVTQTLARIGGDEARELLLGRMNGGTDREQAAALSALGQMDDPAAREALRAAFLQGDDPSLRAQALSAMAWGGAGGGLDDETLEAALHDANPEVVSTAIGALGALGRPDAAERLMGLMQHEDPAVRTQAISALGSTGSKDAEGALIAALGDPETGDMAMWSLQSLGTPGAREAVRGVAREGSPERRVAALGALGSDPSAEAGEILEESLGSEDPVLLSAAVGALSARGTTSSARALGELLDRMPEEGDEDGGGYGMRYQVASALQSLGGGAFREREELIQGILGTAGLGMGDFLNWDGEIPVDSMAVPLTPEMLGMLDGGLVE
jgi:HEAT repeat protein